jgi:PAS domain S-box-containing protein
MSPPSEKLRTEQLEGAFWRAQTQRMRYQELFDFATEGFLTTDLQGIIREANYTAAALLRARREFLIGKPLGLHLSAKSRPAFYAMLGRRAGGGMEACEVMVGSPREEPRHLMLMMNVLADEGGTPAALRWTLRDVSIARRIEQALNTEKHLADCLLELSEIIILLVDAGGRILRCNPFLLSVSGYDVNELAGQDWCQTLLPLEDRYAGLALIERAAVDGSARSGVLGLQTRDRSRRFVTWSARQLGDALVLVGHDVTQLQEAQRYALQATGRAVIGQMATGLAHESRNALQRSQACLSILALRLKNEPELLELLSRIQHAQDDLRRLFEDVRNYASVLPLRPELCDLRRTWREAWENLRAAPTHARAELREDIDGVDPFCYADPFYLRQVFRNLLENALTTGADPIRVVIRCAPAELGRREAIQIRLRDNGPGIAAADRPKLFEPFFTTKLRGTGLGLAICKRIIETHGGRIEVDDTVGPGAEIVITLPRRGT